MRRIVICEQQILRAEFSCHYNRGKEFLGEVITTLQAAYKTDKPCALSASKLSSAAMIAAAMPGDVQSKAKCTRGNFDFVSVMSCISWQPVKECNDKLKPHMLNQVKWTLLDEVADQHVIASINVRD